MNLNSVLCSFVIIKITHNDEYKNWINYVPPGKAVHKCPVGVKNSGRAEILHDFVVPPSDDFLLQFLLLHPSVAVA